MNTLSGCVTGMHRSGTTWLGTLISKFDKMVAIHEPCNFGYGLKGVPRWYIDGRYSEDRDFVDRLLREIPAGSARFQRDFSIKRPVHGLARLVLGNRSEREWRQALKDPENRLLLKDPFLLMMVPYLAEKGLPCVVSVRHPAAILPSLNRMEWQMPLKHLEGRLSDAAQRANPIGPMAETSLFWAEIYRPTLSYLRDGGNNVLVLSHEDMFEDVERTYQSIAKFLDLSDTDHRALNFARESTSASTATAEGKTLHQMSRDSRTLARSFRQKTSPEELKTSELMLDGIYDELRAFAAAHAL